MALRWYSVVIDCRDVHAQAQWWGRVLSWPLVYETDDECVIVPPHLAEDEPVPAERWASTSPGLVFVPVPEGKTVKNRLHLDLAPHTSQDRDAEIRRLLDLGARYVDVGQDPEATWVVLEDPEGNEFCVLSSRDS
jgi:catechol 2,3-dioxygenase-like lactoylglutathione lyase family enzyme